jgi:steroid delta-isomerase-like uncharacterized protein
MKMKTLASGYSGMKPLSTKVQLLLLMVLLTTASTLAQGTEAVTGTGAEQNREIGRRFVAIFNEQNPTIADEIFASNFTAHVSGASTLDREGWKAYLEVFLAAFPDLHLEVEEVIATDEFVILRVVLRGTQTGEFQGMPPTGTEVAFPGIAMHRIENGQVIEHWGVMDLLSLMQQLGAFPAPEASGE